MTNKTAAIDVRPPIVEFEKEVHDKIMYWVMKSPVEISGLGKCVHENGVYRVTEAYLLEQENGPASTDIDAEAAAKLLFESKDEPGHLNFWWHSHVNMGVFWSGTDTSTIKEFGGQGMCLATVFNKKREMRSAFYMKGNDFYPEVFFDHLESRIAVPDLPEKHEAWDKEYEAKCKEVKYLGNAQTNSMYGNRKWDQAKRRWNVWDQATKQWEYWDFKKQNYQRVEPQPEAPGKTIGTHLTGITKGSSTASATFTEKEKAEFLQDIHYHYVDVVKQPKKDRLFGAIHPVTLSLRWGGVGTGWVDHDHFVYTNNIDTDNVLDVLDIRLIWAQKFLDTFKKPPMEDWDIDEFYMRSKSISYTQFYMPETAEVLQ